MEVILGSVLQSLKTRRTMLSLSLSFPLSLDTGIDTVYGEKKWNCTKNTHGDAKHQTWENSYSEEEAEEDLSHYPTETLKQEWSHFRILGRWGGDTWMFIWHTVYLCA